MWPVTRPGGEQMSRLGRPFCDFWLCGSCLEGVRDQPSACGRASDWARAGDKPQPALGRGGRAIGVVGGLGCRASAYAPSPIALLWGGVDLHRPPSLASLLHPLPPSTPRPPTLAHMKLSAPFLLILAALGAAEASGLDSHARAARHHALARNEQPVLRRGNTGRCKVRPTSTLVSSTPTPEPTQAKPVAFNDKNTDKGDANKGGNSDGNKNNNKGSGDNNKNASKPVGSAKGLIAITDSSCGWPGATKDISPTAGPNGSQEWLNCGMTGSGWNPPYVTVDQIVSVELAEAVKQPHSPFKACAPFIDTFTKYAYQHDVPPILIASFAMQESSCNPDTVGGAGEQGLMQLTKDKCHKAPGGNCKDPDYNIRTGVEYFAQSLKDHNGDLLATIGAYNGWFRGMTIDTATEAARQGCCPCQKNIDYLQQLLNGWAQNIDPYTSNPRLGSYFNLEKCY